MKKTVTKITAVLCVVLLLAACCSPTSENTEAEPEPVASVDIQEVPPPEEPPQTISWQEAYADFLRTSANFLINIEEAEYLQDIYFTLRHLTGSEIPELLVYYIGQSMFSGFVVYTFNDGEIRFLDRISTHRAMGQLSVSDDPDFPGIFFEYGMFNIIYVYYGELINGQTVQTEVFHLQLWDGYDPVEIELYRTDGPLYDVWRQSSSLPIRSPAHEITEENIREIIFGWTNLHQLGADAFAPIFNVYARERATAVVPHGGDFIEWLRMHPWWDYLQFALHDINGDGQPELFIGYAHQSLGDIILSVYALQNGEPVRVAEYSNRTSLFLQTHIDGRYIIKSSTWSMGTTEVFHTMDENGELVILDSIISHASRHDANTIHVRYEQAEGEGVQITEEEYLALIYEYGSFSFGRELQENYVARRVVDLDWRPLLTRDATQHNLVEKEMYIEVLQGNAVFFEHVHINTGNRWWDGGTFIIVGMDVVSIDDWGTRVSDNGVPSHGG